MPPETALQPPALHSDVARLTERLRDLDVREQTLAALRSDLHHLQCRYLDEVGPFYVRLGDLDAAIVDAEIRAGIRPPACDDADDADEGADDAEAGAADRPDAAAGCSHGSATPEALKRMFRELAKTIHPDLAEDEAARCRRHSLMAEANRAYAERDEDRLRLILRVWERSPEAVLGDGPEAERERVQRRLAEVGERLVVVDAQIADLRSSAIFRLKTKIDEAAAHGWDLFAEMLLQVRREVARAEARLARLRQA